jgi:hypothetical protein
MFVLTGPEWNSYPQSDVRAVQSRTPLASVATVIRENPKRKFSMNFGAGI